MVSVASVLAEVPGLVAALVVLLVSAAWLQEVSEEVLSSEAALVVLLVSVA